MFLTRPIFWIPLLLAAGAVAASALVRSFHPPLQTGALSLLLSGTVALSIYLFVVIFQPETF
ncbi:potassium-transporting ATPase subunit F [Synechococcus sp. Lug-A]|jgi:K+-transporting ATPase KdpF subunit|uniref:potassium-transporting ATPase subunit F n=1 Tax=unclassified Synechococcus TaxID=2626047 RepID=UPI0020CD91C7|nr:MULTISPECIES: potassium-transporting ATPase subunit F [unclassified Synechococcus]MCP9827072.1 potassium-transporting ATPase subunit F [Synechococcus sp. L2F]MCP9846864.1 potassium-transporting ATPase subunit F [Synechococcus sp. Lug-A]